MKIILITTCLLLSLPALYAQAPTDLKVVSAAAGTAEVNGLEFTWTLGEIAIEERALGNASVVTQGFHQGNLPFATVKTNPDDGVSEIITPGNPDGINDHLTFPALDSLPAKEKNNIIIFNRWGQVVYKAEPYKNDWGGTNQHGQDLPEGTYYFVLFLQDGQKQVIHGNVLVIR